MTESSTGPESPRGVADIDKTTRPSPARKPLKRAPKKAPKRLSKKPLAKAKAKDPMDKEIKRVQTKK
ncbi:MAG: hypothetical protein P8P83_01270 [Rickettsiaceae bacterium]|nr:hypothetical protein [Rickettsiaceae bacterium]